MFQKKVTLKGLAAILLFSIAVSMVGGNSLTVAAGKERYKSSYLKYVKQQQKKSRKKLYYAIISASDGKMPVLLITTTDAWMKSSKNAVQAGVYSYSDGRVIHITDMQSTGSGYPLLRHGKYIISGWHHSSQRLMVSGATGHMESVDGFGIDNAKCHKKSWIIANGKKQNYSAKNISMKKACAQDYYSNAYEKGGKAIIFKKAPARPAQ